MLVEQVDLHELITRLMIIKGIPPSACSDNYTLPSQYSKFNKRATEIAYINMYLYNVALRTRALEYKFTCTCTCTCMVVEAGTGRHMYAHLSLLYMNMYMQVNCTCTCTLVHSTYMYSTCILYVSIIHLSCRVMPKRWRKLPPNTRESCGVSTA